MKESKTLEEYISLYQVQAKNDQIKECFMVFGLSEEKILQLLSRKINMYSIKEFGSIDESLRTVNITTT